MTFSKQISKSDNIDFVKYVAAIMVIIEHSFVIASKNLNVAFSFLHNHIAFGGIGVAIFLSGFLVTQSMIAKKTAKNYFKVRVCKIIPPLFAVIPVTAFVLGPCVTTLSIKEYFSTSGIYKYLLNIVLIWQHFLPGVFEGNPYPGAVNGSLWTLLFEFLCYIATYVAYKLKLLKKGSILISVPMVIAGVIILFTTASRFGIAYSYLGSIVRACLCYYMVMIMSFYYEYWINYKVLTVSINPKLANLGQYSYGIYLVAFPIQQLLVHIWEDMNPVVNSIFTIVLCTVLGKLIHDYIENPHSRFSLYDRTPI